MESKDSQWIRVDLGDLKLPDGFYSSIESLGRKTGIYTEKTDEGFKMRMKPGLEDKLDGFIENLNFVYEKNKDNEELKDDCDKLLAKIQKIAALVDNDNDADEPGDKKEEPKDDESKDDSNNENNEGE